MYQFLASSCGSLSLNKPGTWEMLQEQLLCVASFSILVRRMVMCAADGLASTSPLPTSGIDRPWMALSMEQFSLSPADPAVLRLLIVPSSIPFSGVITEHNPSGRGEEGWSREYFPHSQFHAVLTQDSQDTFWD